jgi:quercetin dioxygenase-like cupin family protein
MRHSAIAVALFAGGIAVGLASSEVIHAQAPAFTTKQVLRTDLENLPGQEVMASASTWQPGHRLPWHMHPDGHEFTYVIEGEQTLEIDGVGTKVVKAGEMLYTPPGVVHYGRNASDKELKTLVVRIKPKDKPVLTEVKR